MNTRVSKLVAMAQDMTNEEREQWLKDIEYEYGKNHRLYELAEKAVLQANVVICVLS